MSRNSTQKVFYRGSYPCDILCIGDAPGESEDSIGLPFIGLSGNLLDTLIKESGLSQYRVGITNATLCTPYIDDTRSSIREPNKEELKNCSPRLLDILKINSPKLVIALGKIAERTLKQLKVQHVMIPHPTDLLRSGGEESVNYARTILNIKDILKSSTLPPRKLHEENASKKSSTRVQRKH